MSESKHDGTSTQCCGRLKLTFLFSKICKLFSFGLNTCILTYIKTANVDLCCNTVIVEVINRKEIAVTCTYIHNDIAMITISIVC